MKIAMVALAASPVPPPGGGELSTQSLHLSALSRALAAAGHEVTVYVRRDDPSAAQLLPRSAGVTVHQISAGAPTPLPASALVDVLADFGAGLRDAFTSAPPDVVHAHYWMSGLAVLQATRDRSVPFAQTFHTLGSARRRLHRSDDVSATQRARMESVIARTADRVLAAGDDESHELRRMGVSYQNISVVPPGIDLDRFYPVPTVFEAGNTPRLLSVGPLAQQRGVADQIRALVKLPGARLTVAGGPTAAELAGDGDAQRLVTLAERLGVDHRVRVVGRVSRDEVATLMRTVDLLLCTPWGPASNSVALEAMACGVPVVASAVGGMQDAVLPGITGELVAPRAPDQLAQTIRRLFADPVRLQAYRFASADRARAAFSWERAAIATEFAYRRMLGIPDTAVAPVDDSTDSPATDGDVTTLRAQGSFVAHRSMA